MHCDSCSKLITMDLEDLGVKASIDRGTNRGTVEFDPSQVTVEQIITQIQKSGYDAVPAGSQQP